MARIHFWAHAFDSQGRPLEYEDVYVYYAGTTTAASIYTQERGGTAVSSPPQIKTDNKGLYQFWVGDLSETDGYASSQKFKVAYDDKTIDNISILPVSTQVSHSTLTLWTTAAPSGYYSDCSHNLDNDAPLVQCWNIVTDEVETPTKVKSLTSNILRIYFPTNLNRYSVTVVG